MTRLLSGTWRKIWAQKEKERRGITNVAKLPKTVILWKGLSLLDPSKVIYAVAAVAGPDPSDNRKTGDMIQVAIVTAKASPIETWVAGEDGGVCPSDCVHRSKNRGGQNTCYVNKARLNSLWNSTTSGRAPRLKRGELAEFGRGAVIRIGMEGDPSAVPLFVWQELLTHCAGWSAYTANWRRLGEAWQAFCMASCSSVPEAGEAERQGWRTFTSSRSQCEDQLHAQQGRRLCLAESHDIACADCRGCDGTKRGSKRPSFHLPLHGSRGAAIRRRAVQEEEKSLSSQS